MKAVILATLLCCSFLPIKANTISIQDAQTVALNFYKIAAKNQSTAPLVATLQYTRVEANGMVSLYAFDITPQKGFVILSASDFDQPIIAYSTESFFDSDFSKTGVNEWLSNWGREIAYVEQQRIMPLPGSSALWMQYRQGITPPTKKSLGVGPLCTTTWAQSGNFGSIPAIYNEDCPYDINAATNTLSGCVATAMAQIMKYWNYPPRGQGIASYNDATSNGFSNNYGYQSFNFNNTLFDWANMPDYLTTNSSARQDSAISLLHFACGVAVNMDYSTQSSDAFVFSSQSSNGASAQQAFTQFFKYDASTIQAELFNNYTTTDWLTLIENELNAGRPVEYQGYDLAAGGHTWVCDGYNTSNMLHMNWGWGGANNGWFSVTNLNPTTTYNFTYNLGALIGIRPGVQAIANPAVICSGSGSVLSINGGPVNANYSWTPSTGLSCTNCASPLASPTHTTIYTVNIDSAGNSVTARVTVYVVQPHMLNYTLSDSQLCNGNAAILSLVGASGISISPAASATWHDSLTALLSPDSTTSYHVVAQSSVCGTSDSANIVVHINQYFPVSFNLSATTICNGSYATLGYTGLSNVVAIPSGNSYQGGNNTLILNPSITTRFSVSGLTSCGSVYTDTFTIIVGDSSGGLSYNLSAPNICHGDSTILTLSNTSGVQITPAGLVTDLGNFTYALKPDSNATFYITGYNAICGGQASAQVNVNVVQSGALNYSVAQQDLCVGGYETIYLNGVTGSVLCYPFLNFYFSDSTDAYAYFVADTTKTYSISATTICGNQGTALVAVNVLTNVAYSLERTTVCNGDSALFTVSGLSGISFYPSTGFRMIDSNNYEFSPSASTYYQLEGYDCHGGINYYSFTLNVALAGVLNYTLPDSNLCSSNGTEVFLNGIINPQINPFNNLFTTDATDYYSYLYPTATTTYTVSGQSICGGNISGSFTVNVFPQAGYVLGAHAVCRGGSTTLTVHGLSNVSITPANVATWLNDSVIQLNPATITDYELTGINCTGTVQQYNLVVDVLPGTNVVYSIDSEICSGNQSYLTISGASNISVNPAINLTYTDSFNAYAYLAPAVTTSYTIRGTSQCTGRNVTDVLTVYIVDTPDFTLSSNAVCSYDTVLLVSTGLNNMTISPANNISYFGGNKVYLYPDVTTTYTISGISLCTNATYSQSFTVTIDTVAPTGAALNVFMSGDTLYAAGPGPFQWLLNGTVIAGATRSFILPTSSGLYTVGLALGSICQANSNDFVYTGINNLTLSNDYQVYPNPSSVGWTLQSNAPVSGSTCAIFDGEGRLVFSAPIDNEKSLIDPHLSPGIYLMKIMVAGRLKFITKLVRL